MCQMSFFRGMTVREPARENDTACTSYPLSRSKGTLCLPTKPEAPVTKTFMNSDHSQAATDRNGLSQTGWDAATAMARRSLDHPTGHLAQPQAHRPSRSGKRPPCCLRASESRAQNLSG